MAELTALAGRADLGELANGLAGTDYGVDLEEARRTTTGLALVDATIRRNLVRRTRGVLQFFAAERPDEFSPARRLVGVLLARADVANLVAVVRGQAAGAAPASILAGTLPVGLLADGQVERLADTRDAPACIRLARTFGLAWARLPKEDATGAHRRTQADLTAPSGVLERALRQDFVAWADGETRGTGANGELVRDFLAMEADGRTVVLALRLVRSATRPTRTQLADLVAPGGKLGSERLANVVRQPSLLRAVEALERTPFGRALGPAGLEALLLDEVVGLEWAVERFLARWAQAQVFRDPLGIGLCVAYLSAKAVEARSLRLIARSLASHWPSGRVQQMLAA